MKTKLSIRPCTSSDIKLNKLYMYVLLYNNTYTEILLNLICTLNLYQGFKSKKNKNFCSNNYKNVDNWLRPFKMNMYSMIVLHT